MTRFLLFILGLLFAYPNYASELERYMTDYQHTEITNYQTEISILQTNTVKVIAAELQSYARDTLTQVRQKAYYLVYKGGVHSDDSLGRRVALHFLLQGLDDDNGGVVGQVLEYMQEFAPTDYGTNEASVISSKLSSYNKPHYDGLVLLAGYINTGKDVLYRHWLNPELPRMVKWNVALALARMGSAEHVQYCLNFANKTPINSRTLGVMVPNLIYTRQREAIDFCLNIVKDDSKNCYSQNPDLSESIICGYRVMELLAPVIIDFPVKTDASGMLAVKSYDDALLAVRKWIDEMKDYKIDTLTF